MKPEMVWFQPSSIPSSMAAAISPDPRAVVVTVIVVPLPCSANVASMIASSRGLSSASEATPRMTMRSGATISA
jgi:hypothetical protein